MSFRPTRKEKGNDVPKRVGHLYEKLSDRAYVKSVLIEACRNRPGRKDVERVKNDLDNKTEELCRMLETETFKPNSVSVFQKYDPGSQKMRTIRIVPFFPDCCIQWLIVDLIRDKVFMRGMDYYCSASIPGRGAIHVYRKLRYHISHKRKNSKYALQCDVKKYYDSIPIENLIRKIERRCKDARVLNLIRLILESSALDKENKTGLCIGFYLNQWLANFYLEDADRAIRNTGNARCYVRYMDNMTILSGNKRKLRAVLAAIISALSVLKLRLKEDFQIFPTEHRDVRSVGFRFYSNGSIAYTKRRWLRARRQLIRVKHKLRSRLFIPKKMIRGILARRGGLKHLSSPREIYRKYVAGIDFADLRRRAA